VPSADGPAENSLFSVPHVSEFPTSHTHGRIMLRALVCLYIASRPLIFQLSGLWKHSKAARGTPPIGIFIRPTSSGPSLRGLPRRSQLCSASSAKRSATVVVSGSSSQSRSHCSLSSRTVKELICWQVRGLFFFRHDEVVGKPSASLAFAASLLEVCSQWRQSVSSESSCDRTSPANGFLIAANAAKSFPIDDWSDAPSSTPPGTLDDAVPKSPKGSITCECSIRCRSRIRLASRSQRMRTPPLACWKSLGLGV
jgi:hypothetical protein